jgi:ATP-binding cassette, subfamily B, bacterial
MTASGLLGRSVRYAGPWAVLLAVSSLVEMVAETVLPAVLGKALDGVLRGSQASTWPIVYAVLVMVAMACEVGTELSLGTTAATSTARLRHLFVRKTLSLGPALRMPAGDLTSRLVASTADTGTAPSSIILGVTAAIPPFGAVIALLLIDPWLALSFAVGLPLIALLLRSFVRDTSTIVGRYLKVQGLIAARLVDALSGARTIAAAGTAEQESERILTAVPELAEHGYAGWRLRAGVTARGAVAGPMLQIIVLAVAGIGLVAGRLSPGELLAAGQYAGLGAGIGPVIGNLGSLARSRASAQRLLEVLAAQAPEYGSLRLPPGPGRVEFRGVAAGGVLDGLDLDVPGGLAVAVVGRSGTGKSVLARLAGRLADPDTGDVLLDGVPLRELDRGDLRDAVGYAFARPALFGANIGESISTGPAGPMRAAAKAACADAFIRRLPDGYLTPLDQAPMSGGELQRLGLARAFASAGRLLVLDDATSSLDTATEVQISRVLIDDLGDRTRLIIAHRATTAARADLVAWLEDGKVRACATHKELWQDPAYRAVFRDGAE